MRRAMVWTAVLLGTLTRSAAAGENDAIPSVFPQEVAPPPRPVTGPQPVPPKGPTPPADTGQNPLARRLADPFAQAQEPGGQPARTFDEKFDGDFGGVFYRYTITTGVTLAPVVVGFTPRVVGQTQTVSVGPNGQKVVTTTPVIVQDPIVVQQQVALRQTVRLPLAGRYSGILITDNDNPRPTDRVYLGYSYYDRLGASLNPGVGGSNVNREMVGFESTFLDGDASIGMRLPVIQQYGPAGFTSQVVGDLTVLSKFVLLGDGRAGDVLSAGLVLTTPTGGGNATLIDGTTAPHSVLFQPWTGFIKVFDRGYAQGITSMLVPTDGRDPTLINNSLAVGYQVYRGTPESFLRTLTPMAEVHVRTPLNHRDPNGSVYFQDQVNLTAGMHVRFRRAVFSPAVIVPVVGPRPWNVEALGYFNYYF